MFMKQLATIWTVYTFKTVHDSNIQSVATKHGVGKTAMISLISQKRVVSVRVNTYSITNETQLLRRRLKWLRTLYNRL